MRDAPSRRDLRDAYDRSARVYDARFEALQRVKYDAVLARLTLPATGRVLDAGCGTGLLAARLSPRQVVGVDLSHGMLAHARGRLADRVQGDLLALPFAADSFAAAFAITALLVPPSRLPLGLAELARIVTPGGVVAVTLLRHDVPSGMDALLRGAGLSPAERFDAGQDLGWIARRPGA